MWACGLGSSFISSLTSARYVISSNLSISICTQGKPFWFPLKMGCDRKTSHGRMAFWKPLLSHGKPGLREKPLEKMSTGRGNHKQARLGAFREPWPNVALKDAGCRRLPFTVRGSAQNNRPITNGRGYPCVPGTTR